MGGRKLWKVAEEYGENSRLVIRPSGRGGKIESLMGGGKETRSKKLEEIGNALRKKRGWRRFLSFFFFFFLEEGAIEVDALLDDFERVESPREWKLPGKLWFVLKHSRVYRGQCRLSLFSLRLVEC